MITFIGIGAQKCASSWIYEVLKQSTQTVVSQKKELDFFSYYFDHGYEWYHSQFESFNSDVIGEISPSYLYNTDVPKRVFEYNPEMKIILSLRDPIKRMFSNHLHEVRAGHVSKENLVFENAYKNNPLYLEQSTYILHVKNWLKYFDKDQLHIVFQEDVHASPEMVCKDLCNFLNLEPISLTSTFEVNASMQNKNALLGQVLNIGGGFFRKMNMDDSLRRLKKSKFLGSIYSNNKTHISEIVNPITPPFELFLRELLEPFDAELKNLMKLEVLPWEDKANAKN